MTVRETAAAILLAQLALTTACSQLPAQEDADPLRDNCVRANDIARSMAALCLYEDGLSLLDRRKVCDVAIRAINATTKACKADAEH